MNPDKVNKQLKKEVRKQRTKNGELTGWSNKFLWNNSIGPNSKSATDIHRSQIRQLDKKYSKEYNKIEKKYKDKKITYEQMFSEADKVNSKYMKEAKALGAAKVVGERYSKEAIRNIGQMNIGYLQDIGFNKETSAYIQNILAKSKRVRIY